MSSPPFPPTLESSAAEKRERLVLLCRLDRANISLLLRQASLATHPRRVLPDVVQDLLQTARFFPGIIGRWAGHAAAIERFLRPLAQLGSWWRRSAR